MLETRKQLKEIIDTKTKQIHAREKLLDEQRAEIHAWQKENKELYDQGRELRDEVEELKLFKEKVINIMNGKDTIVNKYDKINELVQTAIEY
ncbi:MAG: hypothetical protein ACI4VC_04285 [Clostridia bacterium]